MAWVPKNAKPGGLYGIFTRYSLTVEPISIVPTVKQVGPTRYVADIPAWDEAKAKDVLLKIFYHGDIGQVFIDGDMVSDNMCNGEAWELGLREFAPCLVSHPLTIYITPLKEGANVNVESVMAGRIEEVEKINGRLESIEAQPVYMWSL